MSHVSKRPKLWVVLYTAPNLDGSRKNCENCMMWVRSNQCVIHPKDEKVTAQHICGYHIFGKPMDKWMDHPGMDPARPEYSGLDLVKGGTSCDACRYYEGESEGICHAVARKEDEEPAAVQGKGCCNNWESIDEKTASMNPMDYDIGELSRGVYIELQQTPIRPFAEKTAMVNLSRDPDHYRKLRGKK